MNIIKVAKKAYRFLWDRDRKNIELVRVIIPGSEKLEKVGECEYKSIQFIIFQGPKDQVGEGALTYKYRDDGRPDIVYGNLYPLVTSYYLKGEKLWQKI